MVLSGLKCNLNEWTSTSCSCDTHLSCSGAWLMSPLWRSVWAQAVLCHPYGCAPWFPEPPPGRWLSDCHLAADMACATSHGLSYWDVTGPDPDAGDGLCLLLLSHWGLREPQVIPAGFVCTEGVGRAREVSLLEKVVQLWGCLREICLTHQDNQD